MAEVCCKAVLISASYLRLCIVTSFLLDHIHLIRHPTYYMPHVSLAFMVDINYRMCCQLRFLLFLQLSFHQAYIFLSLIIVFSHACILIFLVDGQFLVYQYNVFSSACMDCISRDFSCWHHRLRSAFLISIFLDRYCLYLVISNYQLS